MAVHVYANRCAGGEDDADSLAFRMRVGEAQQGRMDSRVGLSVAEGVRHTGQSRASHALVDGVADNWVAPAFLVRPLRVKAEPPAAARPANTTAVMSLVGVRMMICSLFGSPVDLGWARRRGVSGSRRICLFLYRPARWHHGRIPTHSDEEIRAASRPP
jgi:hypothetical protein